MKSQVSTGRGYTRRGHAHEHPFILQLWRQSEDGKKTCKASFKALYRHGLVVSKKSDSLHVAVKDSVDTAGIYVEELEEVVKAAMSLRVPGTMCSGISTVR
jgi:hypothetical protein